MYGYLNFQYNVFEYIKSVETHKIYEADNRYESRHMVFRNEMYAETRGMCEKIF